MHRVILISLTSLIVTLNTNPTHAQTSPEPAPSPVAHATAESNLGVTELERRLNLLATEIENLRLGEVAPRVGEGRHGLGPAASKVYSVDSGVSIGGYGELAYKNPSDDAPAQADFHRAIIYMGYKFNDHFVLNTEIEIEHVNEIYLEFATLDWLWKPEFNVRGGLLLMPMGLTNEMHEPTTFLGALRPETERAILPTTWRENGLGIFGDIGPLTYRAYAVTGMDASGFDDSGLRGGRQKGSKALAQDLAGVARIDLTAIPGVLVGASAYYGEADHDQYDFNVATLIYEAHADIAWRGLRLRALFAGARVSNPGKLSVAQGLDPAAGVGKNLQGWYLEGGYDVLTLAGSTGLWPYLRYEKLDSQEAVGTEFIVNPSRKRTILTAGLQYHPITELVIKGDYQSRTSEADDDVTQYNLSLGYIF